ncbi:MAG: aspartate 1-decarboxylase [Magnetococcus sp. DMHC-6]
MLKCKIHRARVTQTHIEYEGSCAIDENLMDAAGLREFEQIHLWNVNNGERFVTYAIRGERGSGVISVNGAAAHKAAQNDIVIIAAFVQLSESEAEHFAPRLVYVDEANRMTRIGNSIPAQGV